MPNCKSVYDPQEDSTMLERHVRIHATGDVLDVGTGSGIQAIAASQSSRVKSVIATDIQEGVIDYCNKTIKNRKIKFVQSDLFANINARFDTVIFNPPYLPEELEVKDIALEGGKKGYETIEKFLNQVNNHLRPNGIVLLVFSSLTKKEKVEEFIKNNLFDFEEQEKEHIFFEDIYVYLLRKNDLLKKLEAKKISDARYLAKGHRGIIFIGNYRNKKIAVKAKNPKSSAFGRIENEAKWLKKLNRHGIGPKLLFCCPDYFFYEYISGDLIVDYINKSDKIKVKKVIKNILLQMFAMDKLKIDKQEMHHPIKHIIVKKDRPYLIDFERTRHTINPKNVTQFCQFIISGHLGKMLGEKKAKIIELAKVYKNGQNNKSFKDILDFVSGF